MVWGHWRSCSCSAPSASCRYAGRPSALDCCPIRGSNGIGIVKSAHKGIGRVLHAAIYSARGLSAAWSNEAAFRQELVLLAVFLPLAVWLGESGAEIALLGGVCILVVIVELLNTGLEAVVDRIGSEHHRLAGVAKDVGSAAVLLSLLMVVFVWGAILLERWL